MKNKWKITKYDVFPVNHLYYNDCDEIIQENKNGWFEIIAHATKKNSRLISYAPELLNALIQDVKLLELALIEFERDQELSTPSKIELIKKLIKNRVDLIEKAVGKKWRSLC
jgi:hypothetical protein